MTLHINLKSGEVIELRHLRFVSTYIHSEFGEPEIVAHFQESVGCAQVNIPLSDIKDYWMSQAEQVEQTHASWCDGECCQ
jgi:hypothetical protein